MSPSCTKRRKFEKKKRDLVTLFDSKAYLGFVICQADAVESIPQIDRYHERKTFFLTMNAKK